MSVALHQHRKRIRTGPAEIGLILLLTGLVVFVVSGSLSVPGADWLQAEGTVLSMHRVQNASSALGTPYRINVAYQYQVGGVTHTDAWEGEWPTSLSPNALPEADWPRLSEAGFPLVVLYDPEFPERNSLHVTQNQYPVWWLRLSIAVSILVLWSLFALYPRWKARQ